MYASMAANGTAMLSDSSRPQRRGLFGRVTLAKSHSNFVEPESLLEVQLVMFMCTVVGGWELLGGGMRPGQHGRK